MSKLRSVFLGTPEFALPSLKACLENSSLLAVITQPDRPRGRGHKLSPCLIREAAERLNIPSFAPQSLRKDSPELSSLMEFLKINPPDVFVVTAYGNILPENFLFLPKLGSINVHASLLPRWRGAAPIQRAIEAGDEETGVCLQQMVYALDAGQVLLEEKCPILPNEDASQLSAKLSLMGETLLKKYFMNPQIIGKEQNASLVTHAAKLSKEEGFWHPTWSAIETHQRVRAFSVWPQVKARLGEEGAEIKILQTQSFACANNEFLSSKPGDLILSKNKVLLNTGLRNNLRTGEQSAASNNFIEIIKVQAAGKGPVMAYDFFQSQPKLALHSLRKDT